MYIECISMCSRTYFKHENRTRTKKYECSFIPVGYGNACDRLYLVKMCTNDDRMSKYLFLVERFLMGAHLDTKILFQNWIYIFHVWMSQIKLMNIWLNLTFWHLNSLYESYNSIEIQFGQIQRRHASHFTLEIFNRFNFELQFDSFLIRHSLFNSIKIRLWIIPNRISSSNCLNLILHFKKIDHILDYTGEFITTLYSSTAGSISNYQEAN